MIADDHPPVKPDSLPPVVRPVAHAPGNMLEQFLIASLATQNPWGYSRFEDRYQAARRTVLAHARRGKR